MHGSSLPILSFPLFTSAVYIYIFIAVQKNVMKYLSFYTLHGAGRNTANHINGIANVFNDPSAKSEDLLAYRLMPEKDNLTTCTRHL